MNHNFKIGDQVLVTNYLTRLVGVVRNIDLYSDAVEVQDNYGNCEWFKSGQISKVEK